MSPSDPTPPRAVRLDLPDGGNLAAEVIDGSGPPIIWLGGYASNMQGTKASWLSQQCAIWSWNFIKFDYRGTGQSSGEFADQTLTNWLADSVLALEQLTDRPAVLIGSSMGAWLALRTAQLWPGKVAGLCLIAPAPDFSKRYWDACTDSMKAEAETTGLLPLEHHTPLQLKLVQDANANHLLRDQPIAFEGPVEILHGLRDTIALPELATQVAQQLTSTDLCMHLIKDGDHSLSRPQDLALLWQALARLRDRVNG